MASDFVEFQRRTFLASLGEAKSKLPDGLFEEFDNIENCLAGEVKKKDDASDLLRHLNDLNDTLAECTVFAEQFQDVTESFSCLNPFHQGRFISDMKRRLKNIADEILLLRNSSSPSMAIYPTGRHTSLESIADSRLIGIDKQEKKIRDLISDDSYKAIGLHGLAGSGKTTIISSVLNSASVRNQFCPIIWLCLSDIDSKSEEDKECFEANIVKFILCDLGCDVDKWTVIDPSLAHLLKKLKDHLTSKKYLIVFDDVWENHEFYSKLGDALPRSDPDNYTRLCEALPRDGGGKIIVTTRVKEVAQSMVGEKNIIPMDPLNEESCRKILEDEIGLTGYARKIEDLLRGTGIESIGIYGPSHTANTALVHNALSSSSVCEKFEPKIWVSVASLMSLNQSDQKTGKDEILNIGNEIVKYILKKLGYEDELTKNHTEFELMKIVQERLKAASSGSKKSLIVLANVWHKNYGDTVEWDVVWQRLSRAWPKDGTVIIMADTKETIGEMMWVQKVVHVKLPEMGINGRSEAVTEDIGHYITDDIVDQCHGLPLAAKTLAKIIREGLLQS